MADDNDTSGEFGRKFGAQAGAVQFLKVKAAMRAVANSSNGWLVVFDPDHEEERAREPMIDPADYKRFLAEGYIEPLSDGAPESKSGSDRTFVPAATPRVLTLKDLEAAGIPQVFLDRLAAQTAIEEEGGPTSGATTKSLIAFPQDVGHDIVDDGMGDDAPPAPVKRGRPAKATPAEPVVAEPVLGPDGKPVVPAAS